MALVLADRVKETTTTTGTATYTLAGASTGFESFASIGDGNTTYYACTDGTDFEVGIGTYTASGTTLARTTILQSSNSDSAVSWSAGTKTIFCCQPAEKAVFLDASGNIATFNGSNLTNVNATTLDSLDSTSFLRSDADDNKTSGNLTFEDNIKARFGTSGDLQIYHDGSNSFINDVGTGSVVMRTNGSFFQFDTPSTVMAKFIKDGAVELRHNNNLKFETTSTGATVTGVLASDGVDLGDNEKLRLGASQDLEIFHNGSHSFIQDLAGTGALYIATNQLLLTRENITETFLEANVNGSVDLYYDGSKKLETTSTGATVTGTLVADGLDIARDTDASAEIGRAHIGNVNQGDHAGFSHVDQNFSGNYALLQSSTGNTFLNAASGQTVHYRINNSDVMTMDNTGLDITGNLTLTSTDAGATENPTLDLYRNSASPADNDVLGHINFSGEDSAGNKTVYAKINADAIDVTDGTEDGRLDFKVISNGSESQRITLAGSQTIFQNADVKISDADLLLESTDAGASDAPTIDLFRNSSSPASGDQLGQINFTGKDDGGNTTTFAAISSTIAADPTDGNERGGLELQVASNGTLTSYVKMLTNTIQLFKDTQLFGDFTLNSTADSGAVLKLVSNDPADAADFGIEGVVQFYAENDASESTLYYSMQLQTADISDGSEDGWLYLNSRKDGALNVANAFGADGSMYILGSGNGGEGALKWFQTRSTSHTVSVKPNTPTASRNIFLPDADGTLPVFTTAPTGAIADGTSGQVLTTNGSGTLSFTTVSGGSSTVSGLTDVTITSLQNNDLLKYNSTAGEWQNTNLGISVAPTVTLTSTLIGTLTASLAPSSGTYDQPAYFAEVRNSSNTTTIVTNDNITKSGNTLSFTLSTIGSFILRVKTQDFGDLESEFTNQSFTTTAQPTARYLRLSGSGGSIHTMVRDLRFYTDGAQGGTEYPTSDMTSNTAPSPFVASSSGAYTGNTSYQEWKAFDNSSSTGFWNLGQSSTYSAWFLQLDIGTAVSINSAECNINPSFFGGGQTLTVATSNSSTFASGVNTIGSVVISSGGDYTFN